MGKSNSLTPLRFANDSGMLPSRRFLSKCSASNRIHAPSADGILPVSLLCERFKEPRFIKLPISRGMESVNWLCDRSSNQLS